MPPIIYVILVANGQITAGQSSALAAGQLGDESVGAGDVKSAHRAAKLRLRMIAHRFTDFIVTGAFSSMVNRRGGS